MNNKDKVFEFFSERNVRYFVVGTGISLAFDLTEYLERKGMISSISVKASQFVKNKYETKRVMEQIGINTPRYVFYSHDEDVDFNKIIMEIGFPCVVKSNTDAVQPVCANDEKELEDAINAVMETSTDVLVEECIKGGDITVCVGNDEKRVYPVEVLSFSKAKEYGLKGFHGAYAEDATDEIRKQLFELSMRLIKELEVVGVARVDFIVQDGVMYVLEVNSVIVTGYHGTTYPFFKESGINIAKVSISNAIEVFRNRHADL